MNNEINLIKQMLSNFEKSDLHLNEFFESDSEIIQLGNNNFLLTVDTYTSEDNYRINDPYLLGKNLTSCTLSDIFACGAQPLFFCNSLTASHEWNNDFLKLFSKGISKILNQCNTSFVGGDFGNNSFWSFTGIAIGYSENIVKRKGAKSGDSIFLTGKIGNGNFEAASQLIPFTKDLNSFFESYQVEFPLRYKESFLVSEFASSCIDTSDGLIKSLKLLSELNNCGFSINDIPYSKPGEIITEILNIPIETLMFGESGEYELLFTVPESKEYSLLQKSAELGLDLYKIGSITDKEQIFMKNGVHSDLSKYDIWARDFKDITSYMKTMTDYLLSNIGK